MSMTPGSVLAERFRSWAVAAGDQLRRNALKQRLARDHVGSTLSGPPWRG